MTDLEKYELVNKCETIEELQAAIQLLANKNGMISGRARMFNAAIMALKTRMYIKGEGTFPNVMTRMFGIRQQAMYIKFFEDLRKEI